MTNASHRGLTHRLCAATLLAAALGACGSGINASGAADAHTRCLPAGCRTLTLRVVDSPDALRTDPIESKPVLVIRGSEITRVAAAVDGTGTTALQMEISDAAGARLAALSRDNVGRMLAFEVDGEVLQTARIAGEMGNRLQMSGLDGVAATQRMARYLRGGAR